MKKLVEMYLGLRECPHLGEADETGLPGHDVSNTKTPVTLDDWEKNLLQQLVETWIDDVSNSAGDDVEEKDLKQKGEILLNKLGA